MPTLFGEKSRINDKKHQKQSNSNSKKSKTSQKSQPLEQVKKTVKKNRNMPQKVEQKSKTVGSGQIDLFLTF